MSAPMRGDLSEVFEGQQPASGTIVECQDVSVHFGGVAALSGVGFGIEHRDVVGIVGPNGAGKSTLLNVVSGLLRDNVRGRVELFGVSAVGASPVAVAQLGVARSFQDPPLIDQETVLENVLLGQHLRLGYGMTAQLWRRRMVAARERAARERAYQVLEFLGLTQHADRRAGGLPYGTRKLIDIGRAISSGPRLLLLDEPTSGLDADEQGAVARVLNELHRATPVSILVVEHHMDVVREVANKVIGMQAGTVAAVGTPAEVLDSASFQKLVVGAT